MTLLLIHTGGTIGMTPGPKGLRPEPGLVEAAIAARLPVHCALVSHVFTPLRDSADIGPADWNLMLDLIESHPDRPALITHGTDTMAFTGAALALALVGRPRRVVLCGAMAPLGQGGDAERNLELALTAAQAPGAGVDLAFNGRLLPAAGLVKHHSQAADAFHSEPQEAGAPPARRRFDPARRLAVLTLSPGLPATALEAMLAGLDGAVLRVFGAGTVMGDPAVRAALEAAVATGKRLRAVSQCASGGLAPGAYAAGAPLWAAGVENGGRETPEAALIRLWLRD